MTTILLVENDQEILGKITEIVASAGFQTQACSCVKEALKFDLDQLDAIICNLRLPDLPGTDLIKQTSTPILLASNYASLRSAIGS